MGTLKVIGPSGHDTVTWDAQKAETEDPVAVAAVREAERIFEEQRQKGATGMRIASDKTATRIDKFDPNADEIMMVPRIVGG